MIGLIGPIGPIGPIKGKTMRIAVLMGGTSAEREVSLASGRAVVQGLARAGYDVVAVDVGEGLAWTPDDVSTQRMSGRRRPVCGTMSAAEMRVVYDSIHSLLAQNVDVVFIALHGVPGEDGTIQGMLELAGLPYTGSGLLASAVAMDKAMSKKLFQNSGIPTPAWILTRSGDGRLMDQINATIGFPLVAKPPDQGSTVGLSIVERPQDLQSALDMARSYSAEVLLEQYIPGRELTVSILEGSELPVIEIHPEHGIYDYECKYTKGMSSYTVPADLPEEIGSRLREMGKRTFDALQCRGFGRVDFRLTDDNRPFCLEVNTIPGMTETSLVPKAARAVGIDFPELVDRIVRLALREHNQKR